MIRVTALTRRQLADLDIQARLTTLGRLAATELQSPFAFNERAFFRAWLAELKAGSGDFFVAVQDEKIVGLLCASSWVDDFSGAQTYAKRHWYVRPDARNTRAGVMLWDEFQQRARTRGCQRVLTSAGSSEGAERFFVRKGFEAGSRTYQKISV